MSCTGSKRVESSKGFDCRNMGDVLGKECEKEETTLPKSVESVLREDIEGATSSGAGSESDSDKDVESDEDLSWLLPINSMDLGAKKCKCEGCLKLFDSYNNDKKNAKLLLQSWKEFRNYIRNAYINSPLESHQKNECVSFEENERLHEIIQVMRLCDPYQLFQKIEDEVCSMVLKSRIRQLNLLKDENNPALAEEFITGLIEEYVKLLSSALQLSPAIENLLGPQLQRFGLTWEVLNKQLYRSLVYNHFDVQQNLIRFIEQLRKMLPLKDDLYHELVHQYLAFDGEMTLIGTMWKNVEPLIQEYRNLKSKENEKLNNLLDAMKDFFANKLCSTEEDLEETIDENVCSTSDDPTQYCPDCMTRRGCPCDDCTVTHMMTCEDILLGIESPVEINTPTRSRSRSPLKPNEAEKKENRGEAEGEEQQSCECHACTMPPPDLMDCSVTFNQSTRKTNTHGEGFQLYPHIHGTTSEAENVSNIYSSLKPSSDSVYPHLYNLRNQTNVIDTQSQMNGSLRNQLMQAITANKVSSQVHKPVTSPILSLPSPPLSSGSTSLSKNSAHPIVSSKDSSLKNSGTVASEKLQQLSANKTSTKQNILSETVKKITETPNSKTEGKKNDLGKKSTVVKQKENTEKAATEKLIAKHHGTNKGNGCVISGLCGKCCLKHGSNCLKSSGCNKSTDKHLAAIAKLGLSSNTNSRGSVRCNGKDDQNTKNTKTHSCNKTKHQENTKKTVSKNNQFLQFKEGLEADDFSSPEDSCSEASNSTSTSAPKDSRHCDCCYCEVFGHGMPTVAPVSRNYQEMRERLRLRLNMKKSAKCKTVQSGQVPPQPLNQKTIGVNSKSQINSLVSEGNVKKNIVKDQDLESLLKYIEGGKKSECKDAKKAAKKARQKRKKQLEKERLEEEEEERKRLEAVKRQVTISLVNDNKRSQNVKQTPPPPKPSSQRIQPQTLNLSGLKSLVEKSDPNAVPKMVTIRRVMAPFSTEPTVTITLKGSTPDKDKVLFMLKNGNDTLQPEEKENSKKKKKKKKKSEQEAEEIIEEEKNYQHTYEASEAGDSKKKKKKGKNKDSNASDSSESVSHRLQMQRLLATETVSSKNHKLKNAKHNETLTVGKNSKSASSVSSSSKSQVSAATKFQPQKTKPQTTTNNSRNNMQNYVLKSQSVKTQESFTKTNKSNSNSEKKSVQSNNNNQTNKNSNKNAKIVNKSNNNNINNNKSVSVSSNKQNSVLSNVKNQKNNIIANQKIKNVKNPSNLVNDVNVKQSKNKKQKTEPTRQSQSKTVPQQQSKSKTVEVTKKVNQKNAKNLTQNPSRPPVNPRIPNLQIIPTTQKKEKVNKISKSNKKDSLEEINWKSTTERYDTGKVIINTPSYRLSEVLNSIAPSPPPKEEINLENLRLPPGITITKIEGPIAKPVKPIVQPNHVPKPVPPIVMSTPTLKPNPPPGNVIVVDTGRLKEVMKENSQMVGPAEGNGKKKKKKNKQVAENVAPALGISSNQTKFSSKMTKTCTPLNRGGMTVLSNMDARKMVPLENQQATIIKTSDNMVTIRSPALQQAMNIQAYQNSHSYKPGINGYSNMSLFNEEVNRINDKISNLKITAHSEDRLTRQMKNLNIKDGKRANEIFAQAMASPNVSQANSKKKKKKKKSGKCGEDKEVEPVESVFQPKDIDLENGDMDDDEREVEAFKRFCFQSVPSERKDKVKVNLNIKDIVLKKKSMIGCS